MLNKELEELREFEFIFEKALAPKSGPQDGCFKDEIEGKKSRHCLIKEKK
jgi:hypothetical protein